MILDPKKVAFGRHETFYLRYGWLTKGFWKYLEHFSAYNSTDFFKDDHALVKLGVGKNMVASIRYWLLATQMLEQDGNEIKPTDLGLRLFGQESKPGWDPYVEDEATLWLLHWLLCSNATLATSFFWFFNLYHKSSFSQEELRTALSDFTKDNVEAKTSPATLKNDVAVLTRMYSKPKADKKLSFEESLESPMAELSLIENINGKEFVSSVSSKQSVPAHIIGYALASIFEQKNVNSISVEQLIYSAQNGVAIGAVFRQTESNALAQIENAIDIFPGAFVIRETANVHQVYKIDDVSPLAYLSAYYEGNQ